MNRNTRLLTALLVLVLSSGAGHAATVPADASPAKVTPPAPAGSQTAGSGAPSGKPASTETAPAKPVARADALSGKVLEVIDGGGYTFFSLDKDGEKFWVATPPTTGKAGEELSFQPGIEMRKFKSKSLDRTFDVIYFSGGISQPSGTAPSDDFLMKRAHSMKPPVEAAAGTPAADTKTAPALATITGKVLEKLDGGGYSFFLLEGGGKKTWVAAPPTEGKAGDTLSFQPGFEMKEFKSKSLDRTFESIVFTGGLASAETTADPDQLKKMAHEGHKQKDAPPVDKAGKPLDVTVARAAAPNGYTVAELYAKSAALNGREVAVRGRVVKVSRQIMGKNWVHLQDGSGDAARGTNTIVTTTQDIATVGDVVTATGKLAKDKDFGGGYQYSVIIEETRLVGN